MHISKKTKTANLVCLMLIMASSILHILGHNFALPLAFNNIIFFLYTFAIVIWVRQLQRRILQKPVKRYMAIVGILMIFWMQIRTVSYVYLPNEHFTSRYVWYLYYLPMIFIPTFLLMTVLHTGKNEKEKINKRWRIIYIPPTVLFLMVITNDFHQKAFFFVDGLGNWSNGNVKYEIVYFASIGWIAMLMIETMLFALVKCAVPGNRQYIWVPLMPVLFAAVYIFTYIVPTAISDVLEMAFKPPELGSFILAAFMEGLILAHLFPTNDDYAGFWNKSVFGAGIMDNKGNFRHVSHNSVKVTENQVREAREKSVFLDGGDMILRSKAIDGGISYWGRDISEINRLNKELAEYVDVLKEENDLMNAENQLVERRVKIEEQNRLYDGIAADVKKQADQLEILLKNLVEKQGGKYNLQYASVLTTYIKRRANLMLIASRKRYLAGNELKLAILESIEAVKLCDTMCGCDIRDIKSIKKEHALLIYKLFEEIIELSLPRVEAIMLYIFREDLSLCMAIEIEKPEQKVPKSILEDEISKIKGVIDIEIEGETEYVNLRLPTGGEEQ